MVKKIIYREADISKGATKKANMDIIFDFIGILRQISY